MADWARKLKQRHGKSRVRVARVWRNAEGEDVFVEWKVGVSLLSEDCLPAYTDGDNSAIVATDTMKNTVYVKAKECSKAVSVEEFAILLGEHFTSFYLQVTAAIITIEEKPWDRVAVDGVPHKHGFKLGSERHSTKVTVKKDGSLEIISGIEGLALLKTTKKAETISILIHKEDGSMPFVIRQSGFEGFVRDQYTTLPETNERMLATEVTALWRYPFQKLFDVPKSFCFTKVYFDVKKVLADTFFGPPHSGVYSPSVQHTLFQMGKAVLNRFPHIASIELRMPNIHFLPVNLASKEKGTIVKFADDVYTPTDEPHGTIQATLSRTMSRM